MEQAERCKRFAKTKRLYCPLSPWERAGVRASAMAKPNPSPPPNSTQDITAKLAKLNAEQARRHAEIATVRETDVDGKRIHISPGMNVTSGRPVRA